MKVWEKREIVWEHEHEGVSILTIVYSFYTCWYGENQFHQCHLTI